MEEKQRKRDSFVFRREWREAISDLPNNVRLEVYEAVIDYALFGTSSKLSEPATIAFNFIRPVLERDMAKYEDVRTKRSYAGKLHKGNQYTNGTNVPSVPTMEQDGTNGSVIVNDYGYDYDNGYDNEGDIKENGIKKAADADTPQTIEFEEVKPTKPKRTKFVPPTIEDVVLYAAEQGLEMDVEGFFYYYQSQGWHVGRNPMKDWKSAMKRWAREDAKKQTQQKQYGNNATTDSKRQRDAELAEYLASKIQ